ncbi:MAG TPA: primosomal protein N', partial [Thermopetrobacter sp.]|nr:primosomal protein N' [Thermopetrobacter sp.]
ERGEQTLLFLNRRGYAPLTLCRACGHRLQCPNCSAWLVQHRRARRLLCHHCGHAGPIPAACPSCGAEEKLAAVGPGVERLAEEAARRWPEARLATLSSDLHQGAALKRLLEAIAEGAYDIIIGTQLIAKGHHFPNLTLAGVVDADLALETTDPRAAERTWQLLAQVAGRAGRVDKPGLALIQTHGPEHPLMAALAASDRDAFIAFERAARQAAGMPPFGRLAALIVSARDDEAAADAARRLALARPPADRVMVLGPVAAPIHRLRGRWRYRLLAQSPRAIDLSAFVRAWLSRAALPGSVRLEVDIDPYSFM